jgi:hypothetical protein
VNGGRNGKGKLFKKDGSVCGKFEYLLSVNFVEQEWNEPSGANYSKTVPPKHPHEIM